ncbi:MAG TPA: hypothetical protein PKK23_21490 [Nitrospirales bacterium]|nr:hypothetical protein [Nitrospirales bacterium]
MQRQSIVTMAGLIGLILVGTGGCGIWPVMTEENGRRPQAMGKSDQVLLPWAPHPVHFNEEYGLAYRQSLENQIVNPAAANNLGPVAGEADSQALQQSLARYQLMFQSPPYSPFKLKGGSGGGSSSGGSSGGNASIGVSSEGY